MLEFLPLILIKMVAVQGSLRQFLLVAAFTGFFGTAVPCFVGIIAFGAVQKSERRLTGMPLVLATFLLLLLSWTGFLVTLAWL